ncbi:protein TolA [Kwoniella sp. CBS 6097]
MATVITSSTVAPHPIRAARPEAILIVLFLLVVLFLFLGGSKRSPKSRGTGGSRGGVASPDLESRGREREAAQPKSRDPRRSRRRGDNDDRKESKSKGKSRRSKGKKTGDTSDSATSTSADTSDDEKRKKNKREREREREAKKKKKERDAEKRKKKEQEEKERERAERKAAAAEEEANKKKKDAEAKAKAEAEAKAKAEAEAKARARAKAEAEALKPSDPLSDVRWKRDPTKRPERPSGRSPPVLLKRGENGQWTRPPLSGKKGVIFNDHGVQGKEAESMVTYNHEDPPDTLYDQTDTPRFKDYVSIEKGRDGDELDGALDGSQTPFRDLLKVGGLSKKLLALMQQAEMFCLMDWLDERAPKESMAKAMKDRWIKNVGPIPEVICDCAQQMIIEKAVDLPLMLSTMATSDLVLQDALGNNLPPSLEIGANKILNHLVSGGFDPDYVTKGLQFVTWGKLPLDGVKKLVREWTEKEMSNPNKTSAAGGGGGGGGGGLGMLLGFFNPSYRATTSFFISHVKVARQKDKELYRAIGVKSILLVEWFRYIGKASLVSRMFSPNGADLGADLSVRACALKARRQVGFNLDFTFFVPSLKGDDSDFRPVELTAMMGGACGVVKRARYLAMAWIQHLFENVYRHSNGQSLAAATPDFNVIRDCRISLRPGINILKLDSTVVEQSLNSSSRLKPEVSLLREPKVMDVSLERMDKFYEKTKGHGACGVFGACFRTVGCKSIRFINQRQYHWYNPAQTKAAIDDSERFNVATFQALLVLCGRGLSGRHHPQRFQTKRRVLHDDEGAGMDSEENSAYMMARAIDFGGMIPIVRSGELDVPTRFLPLDQFKHLQDIMLPFLSGAEISVAPVSASLVFKPEWGLAEHIHSGGPGSISVTFHGPTEEQRHDFMAELAGQCISQIGNWYDEAKLEGDLSGKIGFLKQKIELTVNTVRRKVKYVALTAETQDVENRGRMGALEEFQLPVDMLPQELR